MFGSNKTKGEAAGPSARAGKRFAPEGRRALCGLALMAALGLSVSGVIAGAAGRTVTAVSLELPTGAASQQTETKTGDLSDFYKSDSMILLSLPELEAESAFVAGAFSDAPELTNTVDFDDYVSVTSEEEANEMIRQIQARKEREARAKAEREARLAQQQALIQQGGFVRFNRQGIPISQKTANIELDANGVPTHYSYCITGKATAYYGGTRTATGTRPMQGSVAVNPRQIPYGTRMWIVSTDGSIVYGLGVAEDTGGFIYLKTGPTIDVYFNTYEDCVHWGLRNVNIYILD